MERICEICGKVPMQEHHLWCKFLDNPQGNSFKNYENRIFLCYNHHTGKEGIHKNIILPILQKHNKSPKKTNSEILNWNRVSIEDRENTIEEIVKESWRWIENGRTI